MTDRELEVQAVRLRRRLLALIVKAGAGHTGGDLSCIDILNVLYNRVMRVSPEMMDDPHRDRFVQSKGHSVEALYVVLADRGYFSETHLDTVCRYNSAYVGHPTRKVPGIEMNTGALGHGLPICLGMAIAAKRSAASYRVFTLLGDGEIAEGSNWEAGMAASHHRLDNLTAILDHNSLQITGRTYDVMSNAPLEQKWASFGWEVRHVDGHDYAALTAALTRPAVPGKPTIVIAQTVKGKGISFMENAPEWHHRVPDRNELRLALAELDEAEASLISGDPP